MSESSLLIGAPEWVGPAAAIAVGLLLLVLWAYRAPGGASRWRWLAAGLKAFGVATLLFCLVEPLRRGERPRPQANLVPILVDASQSMAIDEAAAAGGQRATDVLRQQLAATTEWRERLTQDFDVRPYAFASRLQSVEDYETLSFTGTHSQLGEALQRLATRFADRPVAGVLLFTDGNASDAVETLVDWSQWRIPIYPVVQPTTNPGADLRVDSVAVNQSHFEASPVTVEARLAARQLVGESMLVQLQDAEGKVIEEKTIDAPGDDRLANVRFRFRPAGSGIQTYRLRVCLPAEQSLEADATSETEVTLENNARLFVVDRPRGPFRVLYVGGRPNWEFKFLRRALAEDVEVELVGLVRIAREQPKFAFRDATVPETNPLFAGLGEGEEEAAEQYDEPVILRLGVAEATDLRAGFPKDAEELFAYHAVLLDDVEADFFSSEQRLLLRRFVAARGGGLMMLGGQESFAKGGYQQTPIGEMLPVYLPSPRAADRDEAATTPPGPYRFRLTREGMLQPWLRLRANEAGEQERLAEASPLRVLNRVREIKPGAVVLATAETASAELLPALVSQRFGKGRSSALLIGDLWRQAMHRDDPTRDDPAQTWRQWIRAMVADVPRRVELQVLNRAAANAGNPVTLELTTRDSQYLPLDNADVTWKVTTPAGETLPVSATPARDEAGAHRASFWSTEPGSFRVSAHVVAADGTLVGIAEAGWTSAPGRAEFERLTPNRGLLQRLAERSGGELLAPDRLDRFVDSLQDRKLPVTEKWVYPIWHDPWMLALAIGCLCGEWGLRRWKGWP